VDDVAEFLVSQQTMASRKVVERQTDISVERTVTSRLPLPKTRICSVQQRVADLWTFWPPRVALKLLKRSPPSH